MFEKLTSHFIRPQRHQYDLAQLGPLSFLIRSAGITVHRKDFELLNGRGLKIQGSLLVADPAKPCVLYLHCNGGSRVEGLQYMKAVVTLGFNYCVFDFSGSGHSEGKYISLGYWESFDIEVVVAFLRKTFARVYLWGRSMGAVAALLYLHRGGEAPGAILDSPFASLDQVAKALAWEQFAIPSFVISILMSSIKSEIKRLVDFELDELELEQKVGSCHAPVLFVASHNDSVVPCEQVVRLQERYGAKNELVFIPEGHNDRRGQRSIRQMLGYLTQEQLRNSVPRLKLIKLKSKARDETVLQEEHLRGRRYEEKDNCSKTTREGRSQNQSGNKGKGEVVEWKKRLISGMHNQPRRGIRHSRPNAKAKRL